MTAQASWFIGYIPSMPRKQIELWDIRSTSGNFRPYQIQTANIHFKATAPDCWLIGMLAEWFKVSATVGCLYHPDKRPNLGCWLTSGFEAHLGHLVVSLFQEHINYGLFTGATSKLLPLSMNWTNYTLNRLLFAWPFLSGMQTCIIRSTDGSKQ